MNTEKISWHKLIAVLKMSFSLQAPPLNKEALGVQNECPECPQEVCHFLANRLFDGTAVFLTMKRLP